MAIICIVVTGSYSYYTVRGVYSTHARAEEAARYYQGEIREYELDALPESPPGKTFWIVRMKRDGGVYVAYQEDGSYAEECLANEGCPGRITYTTPPVTCFFFSMWATDATEAITIANERRLALIAAGRWTDDYEADFAAWKDYRFSLIELA